MREIQYNDERGDAVAKHKNSYQGKGEGRSLHLYTETDYSNSFINRDTFTFISGRVYKHGGNLRARYTDGTKNFLAGQFSK